MNKAKANMTKIWCFHMKAHGLCSSVTNFSVILCLFTVLIGCDQQNSTNKFSNPSIGRAGGVLPGAITGTDKGYVLQVQQVYEYRNKLVVAATLRGNNKNLAYRALISDGSGITIRLQNGVCKDTPNISLLSLYFDINTIKQPLTTSLNLELDVFEYIRYGVKSENNIYVLDSNSGVGPSTYPSSNNNPLASFRIAVGHQLPYPVRDAVLNQQVSIDGAEVALERVIVTQERTTVYVTAVYSDLSCQNCYLDSSTILVAPLSGEIFNSTGTIQPNGTVVTNYYAALYYDYGKWHISIPELRKGMQKWTASGLQPQDSSIAPSQHTFEFDVPSPSTP